MTRPSRAYRVRVGNVETRKLGARRLDLRDPYRLSVASSWRNFVVALIGAELLLNVFFALLYLARPGAIANARPGSLADAFFFSIETLATVGYGEMYPADLYGHVVSAVEIVAGVAFVAVVTGLIFVRFSRPRSPFRFADTIVIGRDRGRHALMIRIASEWIGVLYDAEARLSVLVPECDGDHTSARSMIELPLVRSSLPVLALSWTVTHVIDEASPLFGADIAAMSRRGLRFFLTVRAEDAALATTVRDLRAYGPAELRFGVRYVQAVSIDADGCPVLDLRRLGLVEEATASG